MSHDPGLGLGSEKAASQNLWSIIVGIAMLGVLANVMPTSCAKRLPVVGGKYKDLCDECGGDGKVSAACLQCRGRGYIHGLNCTVCNKTGKVEHACRFCGGSGKKPKD